MSLKSKLSRAGAVAAGLAATAAIVSANAVVTAPKLAGAASVDYFLKIDGVEGEASHENHKNEIEILSWSWGASNSGSMASGGGGGAGKASFSDLSLTKELDKSTPLLAKACMTGTVIPQVELSMPAMSADGTAARGDVYDLVLSGVTCTKYEQSGDASSRPVESFSLNYTKIEMAYVSGDGSVIKASYDLKKNVK